MSDFNGLHSHKHDDEVQLYAFDILALEGDDLRKLPLHLRKTNLARILARRVDGIHLAPFEQGEIGLELYRDACLTGLEETSRSRLCKRPAAPYAWRIYPPQSVIDLASKFDDSCFSSTTSSTRFRPIDDRCQLLTTWSRNKP
ncbi:hypothetical protein [Bradyrhizobium sp. 27S5]|uniref:hypothetical protein n=1 Tax=Bradyrhizobium sp. 27S5 TaxID=3139728 RepID=UPI0030D0B02A